MQKCNHDKLFRSFSSYNVIWQPSKFKWKANTNVKEIRKKTCNAQSLQSMYGISLFNGTDQERGTKEFPKKTGIFHVAPWSIRKVSSSGENGIPQWHYQEQGILPKLMKEQEENLSGRQPKDIATFKQLQEYLVRTCQSQHVTIISYILHMSELWCRLARWKHFYI